MTTKAEEARRAPSRHELLSEAAGFLDRASATLLGALEQEIKSEAPDLQEVHHLAGLALDLDAKHDHLKQRAERVKEQRAE